MNKETRGRKKKEDRGEIATGSMVSLTKSEKDYLIEKFGSLTKAIKSLLPNQSRGIEKPEIESTEPRKEIMAHPTKTIKSVLPSPKKELDKEPTLAELLKQSIKQK